MGYDLALYVNVWAMIAFYMPCFEMSQHITLARFWRNANYWAYWYLNENILHDKSEYVSIILIYCRRLNSRSQ